jgi:phospholipid/cholesterol/gamma-HCH transport system permease protein
MNNEQNINQGTNRSILKLDGTIDIHNIQNIRSQIKSAVKKDRITAIDISNVTEIDTGGALLLKVIAEEFRVKIQNISENQQEIFKLINDSPTTLPKKQKKPSLFVQVVERTGKASVEIWHDSIEIITFFGHSCVALVKALATPHRLRFPSISHHVEQIGINAIPIVGLIAFLISIVLAYQGVAQLRPLGAQQFTVDLVAISVLREMGVLLTAIMVAGRSGSAFTAEIGVMKAREELDALQTIGINPFEILVVPRLIAIMIALPLLTFIANMMGLLGGAVLSLSLIDMSLPEYIDRVQNVVSLKTYLVGMIKAPIFAIAIAVVGCMHGMKVSGSSESVGKETTSSVVKAIFLVIMLDAFFSIIFEKLGM